MTEWLDRAFTQWLDRVHRRAWLVLTAVGLVTVLLAWFTVGNLRVNVDSSAMMASDLPFRIARSEIEEQFPANDPGLVFVVDSDLPELARNAAVALRDRLRAEPAYFTEVFAPEVDPFFERNGLLFFSEAELDETTTRIIEAEPLLAQLNRDRSLGGLFAVFEESFRTATNEGSAPDGLTDFVRTLTPVIERTVEDGASVPMSWERLFLDANADVVSGVPGRIIVTAAPVLNPERLRPAADALEQATVLVESLNREYDDAVRIRLTGRQVLNTEEMSSAYETIYATGLLSLLLVGLVLVVGLRSLWLVGTTLVTLVVGLVWTAAAATAMVDALNLMSVSFAVLFIGLGVDFCIHFTLRFREAFNERGDVGTALRSLAGPLGRAMVLCGLTTALAFYALLPTAYIGLAQLGLISGTGVIVAFLASFTVLPALISVLPRNARFGPVRPVTALHRWMQNRRAAAGILIGSALVVGAAVYPASQVEFAVDRMKLRDMSTVAARTFNELLGDPETSPYTVEWLADAGDAGLADTVRRVEALPEVASVRYLDRFVPDDQADKLALIEDTSFLLLPVFQAAQQEPATDRGEGRRVLGQLREETIPRLLASGDDGALDPLQSAAGELDTALGALQTADPATWNQVESAALDLFPQALERLGTSLQAGPVTPEQLPESLSSRYLSDRGMLRLEARPVRDLSDEQQLIDFVRAVQSEVPEATGITVIMMESADIVVDSILQATLYAAVLVTLALALAYRRALDVALSLFPIACALLLTIAGTVLLGQEFNFANVVVLPLAVGIGVDSVIHMIMRAREIHGNQRLLKTSTPRAVVLSALTTGASFGTLALSPHQGIASMGLLLALSLVCILLCIQLLLPALMRFFPLAGGNPAERPQGV